ncbi:MAG: YhjD/YihY/BrkB family envelope integrity protein [Succinivibrionaceae bacterium]
MKTFLRSLVSFIKIFFVNILDSNISLFAASLSYSTIITFVPLVATAISICSKILFFQKYQTIIENFIIDNTLPEYGKIIRQNIIFFIDNAYNSSLIGFCIFVMFSLLLFRKIDIVIHRIINIKINRSFTKTSLLYSMFYLLTPIMIFVFLGSISYIITFEVIYKFETYVNNFFYFDMIEMTPYIILFLFLFCLYKFIPSQKFKVTSILISTIVTMFLLVLTKNFFTLIITDFTSYSFIYDAFAIVPILLLWIYIIWYIILCGLCLIKTLNTIMN